MPAPHKECDDSVFMLYHGRKWKSGVIDGRGSALKITVSPVNPELDPVTVVVFFLFCWQIWDFVSAIHWSRSLSDLLWQAAVPLVLGTLLFFLARGLFEKQSAQEIVTVAGGRIIWKRQMKWWTRTRGLSISKIKEIFAEKSWTGLADVVITTKWQSYTVFSDVLDEDADRFVRELNRAIRP